MKTAMYLRKSRTEENETIEVTLSRHKETLKKFAKTNMLHIIRIYEEVASGDSLFARPAMLELLRDIENGAYEAILCMDIDRLGRGNMQEQGMILETIKASEVQIITPRKIYDLNNEMDETYSEFQAFMARQELKLIKSRLKRGVRKSIEEGCYVSNAPYGYVQIRKDKKPTLEPNSEEVHFVQKIFQMYIEGSGCQIIADTISNMGAKPHRGERFNRTSIAKIIKNPVYIGKVVWNQKQHKRPATPSGKHTVIYNPQSEWLVYDGIHEPIIDVEIFEKANNIYKSRYHPPYRQPDKIENPMAGVLYCSICGKTMQRRPFNNRKYQTTHILCPTKECVKSARIDYVETALMEAVKNSLSGLEIKTITDTHNNVISKIGEKAVTALKSEESKLISQKEKLYDLLEQGVYTIAVFEERKKLLDARLSEIREQIQKEETAAERNNMVKDQVIPQICHVLQNYEYGTPFEKNQLLKSVINKATYYKAKNAKPDEIYISIQLKNI